MADAQPLPLPDFARVTTGATMIVDEFRKLPNVQAFNSAETLAGITNTLTALNASIQRLDQTVAGLRTEVNTLRTDVNALRTDVNLQINSLRLDMNSGFNMGEHNSRARLHNSKISDRTLVLHKIATSYGANGLDFPANYPTTAQALSNMRVADLDSLLTAYSQSLDGVVSDKKLRLGQFLGIALLV